MKNQKLIIQILLITFVVTIPLTATEGSRAFDYFLSLFIIFLIAGLTLLLKRLQHKTAKNVMPVIKSNLFPDSENEEKQESVYINEGADTGAIVQYFLNLYRTQLNASTSVPSRYFRSVSESKKGFQIYELRVFKNTDEWYTRRVTVGPIGVESGSRSNCFFATYDENIVIKIPPTPLYDFRKYCARIETDRKTAQDLAPVKVITPSISWVMNKAMPQSENEFLNAEQVESRYFNILKSRTGIHDFLKIDGGFVYFMELSENYFMDQALRMIHDTDSHVREEICGYAHLVIEPQAFQGRYGAENSDLSYRLAGLFKEFESRMLFFAREKGLQETLPSHIIRGFFYSRLSGQTSFREEISLDPEIHEYIEQLLNVFFEESKALIAEYFSVLSGFVRVIRKKNLRPVFASLVTNSIDLLLHLREKKIALRDLKPDNLFLDGKKDEFPQFLKDHNRFEIGLIDIETAIDYGRDNIAQPMLAGTPNYATPSHLFSNEDNTTIFGDVGNVFFMQDWHAVTAMIYRTVTFDHLFSESSRYIFEIQGTIARNRNDQDTGELSGSNSLYWKSAMKEFTVKILNNAEYFSSIYVTLTDISRKDFISRCIMIIDESSDYIAQLMNDQPYFNEHNKKSSIILSTSFELEHGLLNNSFQFLKEDHKWLFFNNASEFVRFIILVKARLEWFAGIREKLYGVDKKGVTVFDILLFMFGETLKFFDAPTWKRGFLNRKLFRYHV